ncbi:MAG TPA: anthranilate phosphoribosyltransferase [candidate division Zixibacteria bacterium]|nr:anthranilate phosphoribosyltransferase [candidate division Zixibacteria bacterium]
MPLKSEIAALVRFHDLTTDQAEQAMNIIMNGESSPAQIASYLTALRMKGETVEEITGSARAMRSHVVSVDMSVMGQTSDEMLVDTCGTGGDGKHTFNISTAAAFVVAGQGVKVAKHGNRAASSKCGSADVLIALGGNLDLIPNQVAQCIEEIGIGFLYAINHHPAMRHAIGPRRDIGQRTIFNVLGPLTNPAAATHQLIGVYDPSLTEPMARVLGVLGSRAALVVHGADGLDELSTTGVNRVSRLDSDGVETFELDPQDLGFARADLDDFQGDTPIENAQILRDILSGRDQGPRRDIVLLNAAAALALEDGNLKRGVELSRRSIDSGDALKKLDSWIVMTNDFR